jgi:Fem-1 family protein b
LLNGADVNKQTNCGATAMHFAAQANNIKVIQLLLNSNAWQMKNHHCISTFYLLFYYFICKDPLIIIIIIVALTPILVAAERTHYELVKYLLSVLHLTRKERIEVEELLGASFLNDKDSYDNNLGFALLKHSMEMRLEI